MASISTFLSGLPVGLRDELVVCYQAIVRNYTEQRWEPAELNGGKFCEVVYSIVSGALSGAFPAAASKPANMLDACRAIETQPANLTRVGDRSLRILIPRMLPVLYEIRNNRGVGHVGGEVDPNHEDAEAVLTMTSWVMAELVRIFHGVPLVDAQAAVESIVERRHSLVWSTESIKRVLKPEMSVRDQALVLLYSESDWVSTATLCKWVEYSSASMFRSRVLQKLHQERLVEHDAKNARVRISPLGIRSVEQRLL